MRKILVCEDEEAIREFIVINLKRAGYDVVDAPNGEVGLSYFMDAPNSFDVALLDVMMPGMDGFTLCKRIREISSTIGIIMLTAKTQEMDKVNGLMLGADDYVTKPFSPSELAARVDAIYRRVTLATEPQQVEQIISGNYVLDMMARVLRHKEDEIDLTQVEFQMMELFLKNALVALERRLILDEIWGTNFNGDEKIVDVNVRRIRMKIEEDPSNPRHLQTVWGFGYKWVP